MRLVPVRAAHVARARAAKSRISVPGGCGTGRYGSGLATPRPMERATNRCEVCGNQYDKAFEVIFDGTRHVFDCFACAIHALAPRCNTCGTTLIGHGMESSGEVLLLRPLRPLGRRS